jgi:hypothetical protein
VLRFVQLVLYVFTFHNGLQRLLKPLHRRERTVLVVP